MAWNTGLLAHFLKQFHQTFTPYGDMASLAFLRQCIPNKYHKEIEGHWMLNRALNALSQWCSDTKIHTEKIEQELRSMQNSTNFEQDRAIISKQISQMHGD